MRGRSLYLRLGGGVFLLLIAAALLAPIVAPFDPSAVSLADQFATPSWRHPFGADESGRDLLMLLLHGTRVALGVSIPTVALSALIGIGVGAVAGQRGGLIDGLLLRAVDVALAFPGVLLSIFLLFLLVFVTGIPATEAQAVKSRPDYAQYQREVSPFIPWFPKRAKGDAPATPAPPAPQDAA